MSNFNYAGAFSLSTIAESFNPAIERDASNGGVSTIFRQALETQFKFILSGTPVTAIREINKFIGAEKAPKKADFEAGKAAAIGVAQALHALGAALHTAGRVKNLPMLADLADWCHPDRIAEADAAKVAAKEAKDALKAAEKLRLDKELSDAAAAADKESAESAESAEMAAVMADIESEISGAPFEVVQAFEVVQDNAPVADILPVDAYDRVLALISSGIFDSEELKGIARAVKSAQAAQKDAALV